MSFLAQVPAPCNRRGCGTLPHNIVPRLELFPASDCAVQCSSTRNIWLFKNVHVNELHLIKFKFSSPVASALFQVPSPLMWLVTTILDSASTEHSIDGSALGVQRPPCICCRRQQTRKGSKGAGSVHGPSPKSLARTWLSNCKGSWEM